ncbi:hypothetical protein R70211_01288 [Paraburkholderia domus]|uniref:Uncharacterized protein n=1 Tax=Paraburkholderia domus TaxID=2793075 RepID=A0A9N8MKY9_9BURK|nr:hypothetical protein R70211_01288 [Paraburkholderia domus]
MLRARRFTEDDEYDVQRALLVARIRRESDAAKAMFGAYACGAIGLGPTCGGESDTRCAGCEVRVSQSGATDCGREQVPPGNARLAVAPERRRGEPSADTLKQGNGGWI